MKSYIETDRELTKYKTEFLNQHPVMSQNEELEKLRMAKSGDRKAYEELVYSNIPFVISTARAMHRPWKSLDLDDLVQEGIIGLHRAIEGYDESREVRLITYAKDWIRQEIQQAYRTKEQMIRIPEDVSKDISYKLQPFIEERAKRGLGTQREDVERERPELLLAYYARQLRVSGEEAIDIHRKKAVEEEYKINEVPTFEKLIGEQLGDIEREVLTMRLQEEKSIDEVAETLSSRGQEGYSRMDIRDIELRAIRTLGELHPEYASYLEAA